MQPDQNGHGQPSQPPNSQGGQQPPYQPPFYPGQFQFPPNQQRPDGFRRWFSSRKRSTNFALGCGTLFLVLFLCICSLAIHGSIQPKTKTATPTTSMANNGNSQSTPISLAAKATATPSPTPTATPSPTPSPTLTPTPTPRPTPTPTPRPTPTPTPRPKPTPTPAPTCVAVNNNPWCYNFNPGNLIYSPPSGFCNYFGCIASFYEKDDPGDGYIVECNDGSYSQSGGERGACSYHGGVMRPLYSH